MDEVIPSDHQAVKVGLAMLHRLIVACGGEFIIEADALDNLMAGGCSVKVEEVNDAYGVRSYYFQASV